MSNEVKRIESAVGMVTKAPAGNVIRDDLECGDIHWIVQADDGSDYATCDSKSVAEYIATLSPEAVRKLFSERYATNQLLEREIARTKELESELTERDRRWLEKVEAVLAGLRAAIDDCGNKDCDVCAAKMAGAATDIRIAFADLLEDK